MQNFGPIPTEQDWGKYQYDLDEKAAHDQFIGKTVEEMIPFFEEFPLSAGENLRYMPPIPFRYYVFGLVRVLTSEGKYPNEPLNLRDACFVASAFLDAVLKQLKTAPKTTYPLMQELLPVAQYVAANPERFDEDRDGIFREKLDQINQLCVSLRSRPTD